MSTTWDGICDKCFDVSSVPNEWARVSSEAEEFLRRSLQFKLLDAMRDELVNTLVAEYQLRFYVYFWAFSIGVAEQLTMPDSLGPYRQGLCSLTRKNYLALWADFYCMRTVLMKRHDGQSTASEVGLLAKVLDLTTLLDWAQCCSLANDEARFLGEVSTRMYRSFADKLNLPCDSATLSRLCQDDDFPSNSIAMGISDLANHMEGSREFLQCIQEVLSA